MNLFLRRVVYLILLYHLAESALFAETPIIMGVGNVKSVQNSVQTLFYTPTVFYQRGQVSGALCYANRYLVKDFSTSYVALGFGTKLGSFNLGYERFGNECLNWNRAIAGYAQEWGHLQLGVSFNYLKFISISSTSDMIYSLCGAKLMVSKALLLSVSIQNMEQSEMEIDDYRIPIPTIFLMGARWQESRTFTLLAECEKDLQHPINLKVGGEISLLKPLGVRVGVCKSEVVIPTVGFWFLHNKMQFDVAYNFDNRIGSSCSVSITYSRL